MADGGHNQGGLVGQLPPFDAKKSSWTEWCEVLEHYIELNNIQGEQQKRALLITSCGLDTYQLMRNLVQPSKPKEKSFKELIEVVQQHTSPKPSEIVERFKFNSRSRKEGESVQSFVAELRKLSEHCNYGTQLNDMLRDRLVCGVNQPAIQRKLLSESSNMNFEQALKIAVGMESATRDLDDITRETQAVSTEEKGTFYVQRGKTPVSTGKSAANNEKRLTCWRCGGGHGANVCHFKDEQCFKCKQKGHTSRKCEAIKKWRQQHPKVEKCHNMRDDEETDGGMEEIAMLNKHFEDVFIDDKTVDNDHVVDTNVDVVETNVDDCVDMWNLFYARSDPYLLNVGVNGLQVRFEIDTGSPVTIMSKGEFVKIGSMNQVNTSVGKKLRTYTGSVVNLLGVARVVVELQGTRRELEVHVVEDVGPNLLGRDWIKNHPQVGQLVVGCITSKLAAAVNGEERNTKPGVNAFSLSDLLQVHHEVFEKGMGTLRGTTAKIHLKEGSSPRFMKARSVPYVLQAKIERELERMQSENIIEAVKFSEWATPIVPVLKPDGSVRICGDYKVTVNRESQVEQYPIPRLEDLLVKLGGGKLYSKLDMSHAYNQLLLDEESQNILTLNTHKGLFRVNRLAFGVSSAPAIFQRTVESLVGNIPGVVCYLDDILIAGQTEAEHVDRLTEVLQRLGNAGLRLKREKCVFMVPEVEYIGHKLSAEGVAPLSEKIEAIQKVPVPRNVSDLQTYLGLLNYYHRFLPNVSGILAPLHELLRKGVVWRWGNRQQTAFEASKRLLQSDRVLVHYQSDQELVVNCDSSGFGVGAVLSHRLSDGSERPISFASRSLSTAEKNYSALDREALAVMFAVRKFHRYLMGRKFSIVTDHKPLIFLFSEVKSTPQMSSARRLRWSLELGAYDYQIVFRSGKENQNADALSRLPLETVGEELKGPQEVDVLLLSELDHAPVRVAEVRRETQKDPVLSKVKSCILQGWPKQVEDGLRPYFDRRSELTVEDGCVLWGSRVVVPQPGRELVLKELHQAHPGMSKMKGLARSYVWWPDMDKNIEVHVQNCEVCLSNQKMPEQAPLHPWEMPTKSWSRIHVDYAGPVEGKMILVTVDSYSKWIEADVVSGCTAQTTIKKLRHLFAAQGVPEILVSDNGPCFTSSEFSQFLEKNGVRHITSAPYHPATNGLAERAVQTVKSGIKKVTGASLEERIDKFLFHYRITPQTTTGVAPCELLNKRLLRSRLDLLRPSMHAKLCRKQEEQVEGNKTARKFQEGDSVIVRNYSQGLKWVAGSVVSVDGERSYTVKLTNGALVKRHVDQMRKGIVKGSWEVVVEDTRDKVPIVTEEVDGGKSVTTPRELVSEQPAPSTDPDIESSAEMSLEPALVPQAPQEQDPPVVRRSVRIRKEPSRFQDFVKH
jgi:hypothetical protein